MTEQARLPFGGDWTEEKLRAVRAYLAAYVNVMKNQSFVTTYIDGYRKRRRLELSRHLMASRESLPAAQDDVAEQVDVRAALDQLSPRERACLVLHYYEDLGVAQIADQLGCSVGAVKRYLSEARASFEQALGRPGAPDDHLTSPTPKGAHR